MKALTIHQPYAELIARGEKRVENRSWRTHYRGALAIHAGLRRAESGERRAKSQTLLALDSQLSALDYGAIIAVAELVACLHIDELRQREGTLFAEFEDIKSFRWLLEHEHTFGPWCWVLANVRRLAKPIPITGTQMLWEVPPKVVRQIKRRLA
jgi:hypothetical protein